MTPEDLLHRTAGYVRSALARDASGHDWWHIHRVHQNALALWRVEGGDRFTIELAALLHDLDDWKLTGETPAPGSLTAEEQAIPPLGDAPGEPYPVRAEAWMRHLGVETAIREHVCEIIAGLSFKGAQVATPMRTLEGQIVQDADRLDAIGAIGIARAFAYGGHKGRLLYDPATPPQMHASFEAYRQSNGATLNHFYEKLLLLKDRMNTPTAKRIATERHAFMEAFLAQFLQEWEGEDFSL